MTFASQADAEAVAEQLKEHGIDAELVKKFARLDEAIIGTDYSDRFELYVADSDYKKANEIVYSGDGVAPEMVAPGHPLLRMSNDELLSVLKDADEWGPDNYKIALGVLGSRGVEVGEAELAQMRQDKTNRLLQKKHMSSGVLLLGYLVALIPYFPYPMFSPCQDDSLVLYAPGVFGIIIGVTILKSRTRLPDGKRVNTYSNRSMLHGRLIVALNLLMWLINVVFFFSRATYG